VKVLKRALGNTPALKLKEGWTQGNTKRKMESWMQSIPGSETPLCFFMFVQSVSTN
jgi:hypothetical protein